jgi:type IV pilus assembly protein PilQ
MKNFLIEILRVLGLGSKKVFRLKFSLIFCFYICLFFSALNAQFAQEPQERMISMDFQDAHLKDLLKVLSIQSGLNFIASEGLQDRKITLYLDNVPLDKAMDKLFKANNLTFDLDREANIFVVKDWGKPQVETITKVFFLKHATVSSSSLLKEMSYQLRATTTAKTETETTVTTEGGGDGDIGGITSAVAKLLSSNGSVIEDFRTNSLIVTDIPSRIPIISQVIVSLDVPVPQVMLEVEMLDVNKGLVDKLGVDWPEALAKLDLTLLQRTTAFPFRGSKFANTSGNTTTMTTTGTTPKGEGGVSWAANSFGPGIFTLVGSELILNFLRTQTDTKTLARPKILTLNNGSAEIKITTQEVVGEKKITSGEGGAASITYEAERYETGVSLRVTPQINLETGEITMFIVPTVTEANKSSVASAFGATYWNPEVRSTKSIVKVKDGETVVLGGLIRNEFSQTDQKLPFLGDIPLIGGLFRYKYKDKDKQRELLVFITPHILKEKDLQLAQTSRSILVREQGVATGFSRKAIISSTLNSFEKK